MALRLPRHLHCLVLKETVLTARTEELDPTAPPTTPTLTRAGPDRRAETSDLAMTIATRTREAEEEARTRDASAFTTRMRHP